MRVTIDRGAEALRLELGTAPETRRVEVADGVAVAYDAANRIVGIEVRGVEEAALHEFTVELAGLADRPAAGHVAPAGPPPADQVREDPAPPTPPYYTGPLTWEPEAEAAILEVPFFSRGQRRIAAGALARRRGVGHGDGRDRAGGRRAVGGKARRATPPDRRKTSSPARTGRRR